MIADRIVNPLFWVLAALAITNLSQRKHVAHGGRKRFATLYLLGLSFILYAAVLFIAARKLPDWYLIAAFLVPIAIGYYFRDRVWPFRRKCLSCGETLSFNRVLYYDSNMCENCDPPPEPATAAAPAKSAGEPPRAGEASGEEPAGIPFPDRVEEFDWDAWEPREKAVVCYIRRGDELLLIHKKTGLGQGKINAPGGRIESWETARDAAVRETEEEVGLTPHEPRIVGELNFLFKDGYSLRGTIFYTESFEGEPVETEEADPFWCRIDEIPYDKMWEDDQYWLPRMLEGENFTGRFIFDDDKMLSHQIDFTTREGKTDVQD